MRWLQDGTSNGDKVHHVEKAVIPGALSEKAIQVERLQKELRTVAALEVMHFLSPSNISIACKAHTSLFASCCRPALFPAPGRSATGAAYLA